MSNRNATASWSGYSHQGQVGILVALREIRRLMSVNQQAEFAIHWIEYESFEDIAIYKIVNHTQEFLSVHQVKAYYSNGHLFNTYREVFTGKPTYQKDANGKNIKDAHGNKILTGNYEPSQWCPSANYLHSAIEIGNWPIDFTVFGGNPHNIDRYIYSPGISHCGTDEISIFILEELNSVDFHNGDQGASVMALQRLSYQLDEKIRFEHSTKESKNDYEIKFSFQELLDIITSTVDLSAHDAFNSRKLFYDTYIDIVKNENISQDKIDNIHNTIIKEINALDDSNFLIFLQRLNLNETPARLKLPQIYYNAPGLKQVFFRMIIDILDADAKLIDNAVKYNKNPDHNNFVLTAITDEERDKLTVIENILTNLQSQNLLWESHSLVNKEIEIELVQRNPAINAVATAEEKEDDKNKFMSFNNSKLVKRDHALAKLNNGTTH